MASHRNDVSSSMRKPVFIIGGSRTGSEMLKTMLSASPELNFTDELYVLCPWWLHKDLRSNLRERVGDMTSANAVNDVIDLVFSGVLYGWTWSVAEQELDKDLLREELLKRPVTVESILTAVLAVNARLRDKPRAGAKFPVHYSYAQELLNWYPDCRLIHTTRDPRAVYASQANKYIKAGDRISRRIVERCRQFTHINIQVAWTAEIHRRLQSLENYRLVRYEDVVANPEERIRELCRFLDVQFVPEMLHPQQYGSTFGSIGGRRGVDPGALQAWRSRISPITATAILALQTRATRILGYT